MTRSFVNQYKLFFILLWVIPYFIYPSWALPVSETTRYFIVSGLLIYFLISLYFFNIWFSALNVDKPFIIKTENWLYLIKNNLWLSIICFIAAILHVYQIVTRPILIIGDEALHIHGGLWIYNYIDSNFHKYFQFLFWILVGSILFLTKQQTLKIFFTKRFSKYKSNNLLTNLLIVFIFCLLVVYFFFLQNLQYYPSMIRYPPLSRLLYLVLYFSFGINHLWPRVLQLAFYLLGAIYLYRTIGLFSNERTALLGASIYLFFPVTFIYAGLAELGCGTVFFIILISYYFLRFIKNKDNRDLVLTCFFISAGFLYKRSIFLMVFICAAYLIYNWIKNKDVKFSISFKVMLLSLVPIVPWMIIGKFFTWRNYKIVLSNFIPPHGKVFAYFLHLPLDISWILFALFMLSIIFILILKRNNLSLFFLLLFITYYLFYAIDMAGISPRLSMAFYPTIAVFTALFISVITDKVRWKHSFKFIFVILISYLIAICTVPSLNASFLKSAEFRKLQNYPSEKAMKWVKDNVKNGEKTLTLRIMPALFYRDKYGIDKNKIVHFWYELYDVSTPEKLRKFIIENRITYIMFPYGPEYHPFSANLPILQYLKENRDNEFIEATKFNIGENYIFIYTVPVNIFGNCCMGTTQPRQKNG